jgi:hypothetical protein
MEADVLFADTMPPKGGITTRRRRIRSQDPPLNSMSICTLIDISIIVG